MAKQFEAELVAQLNSDVLEGPIWHPDLGEVREELDADYDGDDIAIGFNPKYVIELLSQMATDQVIVELNGDLDPGVIRPLSGDDYLGVVMPMRI